MIYFFYVVVWITAVSWADTLIHIVCSAEGSYSQDDVKNKLLLANETRYKKDNSRYKVTDMKSYSWKCLWKQHYVGKDTIV